MQTLKLSQIRTKQDLQLLYAKQMGVSVVRSEINEIICATKNKTNKQRLSPKEILQFIKNNGLPAGYIADDELNLKLQQ